MDKNILISVFIPVYNREKYVKFAIESILNQTYQNFELIIINDGSTDNSLSIIQSYDDDRIRIINNIKNKGVAAVGNQGIAAAKGKYFVRLDSDDIAHPRRLEKQVNFLERNPQYALVSTQAKLIFGDDNQPSLFRKFRLELNPNMLLPLSLFYCPVIQGSMMIKTAIIHQYQYDESMIVAEDYDLFTNILKKHQFINLRESLFYCRHHEGNISKMDVDKRLKCLEKIYKSNLKFIQLDYTNNELNTYLKISAPYPYTMTRSEQIELRDWLIKMQQHLLSTKQFNLSILNTVFGHVWYQLHRKNTSQGIFTFFSYLFQRKELNAELRFNHIIFLFIKCFFKK